MRIKVLLGLFFLCVNAKLPTQAEWLNWSLGKLEGMKKE